ncbi:Transmembrane exosortase [Pseudovibrio axinellae]|uniref:Transmembrane exosortase n=1 Tax=Pseudovibrio axinellae TaxID=989403 RepID=A0A165YBP7_9HYPH|nr:exosortase T [Pseudovibrio axinellae]KZL18645.1 Transmembrane exosortase [Pseudovibrio axinellae]SER73495.1 exosortase/archaeosortase family protein [Pseudovibrio axinellae]
MKHFIANHQFTALGFGLASAILAFEPALWLIRTWFDPSYSSSGAIYLFVIGGLLLWSLSSPIERDTGNHRQTVVLLLVASAFIRLISQVFAINVVGGLALAIDVFAIATLLRVGERQRALSPLWLSVLFLFSLPIERIVQRLLGYPLQELSADISCLLLNGISGNLSCNGVRLTLEGKDVLVDLPCSGTSSLMLSMAFIVVLNGVYRPRLRTAVLWSFLTLAFSVLGNSIRISALAMGIAYPQVVFGHDVMLEPLHSIVGYLTLALTLLPILIFYRPKASHRVVSGDAAKPLTIPAVSHRYLALVFVAVAVLVVSLPRQAIDVAKATEAPSLPIFLDGVLGQDEPLLPVEKRYLSAYGGYAVKKRYGAHALTLVHTSSPLRHLHAPDDCLRGLGYKIEFLGSRFDPMPTALYRATSKDGQQWQVSVSFVSSNGDVTHNVAEAIWIWLQAPSVSWTSIQRISPWQTAASTEKQFEAAVVAALDFPRP